MDRENKGKGRIKREGGEKEMDIYENWQLSRDYPPTPDRSIFET